jgi:hypothetical protein
MHVESFSDERLLKEDIAAKRHKAMQPQELRMTRLEYQCFPKDVIRKHIHQEVRSLTAWAVMASNHHGPSHGSRSGGHRIAALASAAMAAVIEVAALAVAALTVAALAAVIAVAAKVASLAVVAVAVQPSKL